MKFGKVSGCVEGVLFSIFILFFLFSTQNQDIQKIIGLGRLINHIKVPQIGIQTKFKRN